MFFPEKLDLDGTFEEMVTMLYDIFQRDIKDYPLRYKSLRIVFDNSKINSEYEEGFWHIITMGKDERLLDYQRAKRLPWIKPIIENCQDGDILRWIEYDKDRRGKTVMKTYLWYRDGRYLIVLKEIPGRYFLTTAFYVSGKYNDEKYYRRYEQAKKKGPEC